MEPEEVNDVLGRVAYKDWSLTYYAHIDGGYLQWSFVDRDGKRWTGRKWKVSFHMTRSELVQTAFKAALTAEEHEARESFTYRGLAVFGPHHDVDLLWDAMWSGGLKDSRRG